MTTWTSKIWPLATLAAFPLTPPSIPLKIPAQLLPISACHLLFPLPETPSNSNSVPRAHQKCHLLRETLFDQPTLSSTHPYRLDSLDLHCHRNLTFLPSHFPKIAQASKPFVQPLCLEHIEWFLRESQTVLTTYAC